MSYLNPVFCLSGTLPLSFLKKKIFREKEGSFFYYGYFRLGYISPAGLGYGPAGLECFMS